MAGYARPIAHDKENDRLPGRTILACTGGHSPTRTDGGDAGVQLRTQRGARPPGQHERDGPGQQRAQQPGRQVRGLRQARHGVRRGHAYRQRRRRRAALRTDVDSDGCARGPMGRPPSHHRAVPDSWLSMCSM